jgi:hypothetical protein
LCGGVMVGGPTNYLVTTQFPIPFLNGMLMKIERATRTAKVGSLMDTVGHHCKLAMKLPRSAV